ncbi:MAG: hypothetical protein K0Q43_107 [Ramlibacter sp.]|jgi:hypothetical protein|nr:hypothetical protein [Ramlibacter sp.]
MNATLVISTDLMPAEAIASAGAASTLRAQLYRSTQSGFAAWLCLRPVLWGAQRVAAMVIRPAGVAPADLLSVLDGQVDLLHSRVSETGELMVLAPWSHRERMEVLVVDMAGVASDFSESRAASDLRAEGTSTAQANPQVDIPQAAPASADELRFSATPEGSAARAALLSFGNGKPGLLGRLVARKWDLPWGVQVRESEHRRRSIWRLEFTHGGAEHLFLQMCSQLQSPLEVTFVDDGGAEAGMTLIQPVEVSAPAGDLASRKRFAGLLWDLLHSLWLEELQVVRGSSRWAEAGRRAA